MLLKKIKAVERILNQASTHSTKFADNNQLFCEKGCGKCCLTKNVEATVLEFIPAAYYLFKNDRINEVYEKIENMQDNSICTFYSAFNGGNGQCEIYQYRGLICRLFGFATHMNKKGELEMVSCNFIKSLPANQQMQIGQLNNAPKVTDYYMKLSAIDLKLANEQFPVNMAIQKAIEIVILYFQFKGKKSA